MLTHSPHVSSLICQLIDKLKPAELRKCLLICIPDFMSQDERNALSDSVLRANQIGCRSVSIVTESLALALLFRTRQENEFNELWREEYKKIEGWENFENIPKTKEYRIMFLYIRHTHSTIAVVHFLMNRIELAAKVNHALLNPIKYAESETNVEMSHSLENKGTG